MRDSCQSGSRLNPLFGLSSFYTPPLSSRFSFLSLSLSLSFFLSLSLSLSLSYSPLPSGSWFRAKVASGA